MPDGYCIGSVALLSYGSENGWQHLGWHEIQRGGWNAERGELSWTEVAEPDEIARRRTIPLSDRAGCRSCSGSGLPPPSP